MNKLLLIIIAIIILGSTSFNNAKAEVYGKDYYPYTPRWADIYIGAAVSTNVDQTADDPEWQALYNPLKLLNAGGFSYFVGIRPLGIVPFIRNFRFEGEGQFDMARYKILHDTTAGGVGSWIPDNQLPAGGNGKLGGKIYLKEAAFVNAYYDLRWFSDILYPFVGMGVGMGKVGIFKLDLSMLSNGVGQEYVGFSNRTPLTQFMAGIQYDTKIIKTSFFIEYRYLAAKSIKANPSFLGNEPLNADGEPTTAPPEGFEPAQPKDFTLKIQSIVVGLKYYLY